MKDPKKKRYRMKLWTGPVDIKTTATRIRRAGVRVVGVGTEHVYAEAKAWTCAGALTAVNEKLKTRPGLRWLRPGNCTPIQYAEPGSAKRKPRSGLGGVSADEPLNMAQFIVGRAPGERVGAVYKAGQRPACRVGEGLKVEKGVIPFKTARNAFLRARAHFLGGEAVGGAGATTLTAHGDWRDPVTGKVYDEPTFIGQVIWHKNKYEPTPQVFRDQMKKMCEDVACRLAQREIILRLDNGLTTTITRCTPRGKPPL